MIKLVRCDDRLIHWECMTIIVKVYDIKRIIIIDKFIAGNPILKTIFKNAVPSNMTADVYTTEESVPQIKAALTNDENTLLLVSNPTVFPALYDAVPELPQSVNIGPMSKKDNTKEVIYGIYVNPEETAAIKNIADRGVEVYFNAVPENTRAEWDSVKDKLL